MNWYFLILLKIRIPEMNFFKNDFKKLTLVALVCKTNHKLQKKRSEIFSPQFLKTQQL